MTEQWRFERSLVDETGKVTLQTKDVRVTGSGHLVVGEVIIEAEADAEKARASARAKVTTGRVEGQIAAETPMGDAQAAGHAEGPSAEAAVHASPDGVGGTVGASAGEAGGSVGLDVLGEDWNVGGEVGLKAELGFKLGSTTRIDLPLISIEAPNPGVGAAEWATKAALNLAEDPAGTLRDAARDATNAAEDVGETAGEAVQFAAETAVAVVGAIGGLFEDDDGEDRVVTSSDFGGYRPPGNNIID